MINELLTTAASLKSKTSTYFARQRLARSLRPSDLFIVTYPKSGTNWIGYFLACLLLKKDDRIKTDITLANYRQYIPDINTEYMEKQDLSMYNHLADPRVFTVHAPYDPSFSRVVYVVRDPRDVMVSYYYYHCRTDPSFSMSIDDFVQTNSVWPCDWGVHVSSWLHHAQEQHILLVRYEDLLTDPAHWFEKIVTHATIQASNVEIARAVDQSSFNNMRRLEEKHGIRSVNGDQSIRYTRQGKAGNWRTELKQETVVVVEERYPELMNRLGYHPG